MREDFEPGLGLEGQAEESALSRVTRAGLTAGAAVAAAKVALANPYSRRMIARAARSLSDDATWRAIRHLDLEYSPQAADAAVQVFGGNSKGYREWTVQTGGLRGVWGITRGQALHSAGLQKPPGHPFSLERLKFEMDAARKAWAEARRQTESVFRLYREPDPLQHQMARRSGSKQNLIPGDRPWAILQLHQEAHHAARRTGADLQQVAADIAARGVDPRLGRRHPETAKFLDLAGQMRDPRGAALRKARGDTTTAHEEGAARALLGEASKTRLFTEPPKPSWLTRVLGLDQNLRPLTLEEAIARQKAAGEKEFRFSRVYQRQRTVGSVSLEAMEELQAQAGRPLYVDPDMFVDASGELVDLSQTSLRAIAGRALSAVKDVRVPILGFQPARLFLPEEMSAVWGRGGPIVEPVPGGFYLRTGEKDAYGRNLGKTFRATSAFGGEEEYIHPHRTAAKADKQAKRYQARAAAAATFPGFEDPAVAAGLIPFIRFGKLEEAGSAVLVPQGPLMRGLAMTRGERLFHPIPDEHLAQAIEGVEPGEATSQWSEWTAKTIRGLSKAGIDWRNQKEPNVFIRAAETLTGDRIPLHLEDWTVPWHPGQQGYSTAYHGKYIEHISEAAERQLLESYASTADDLYSVGMWSGVRTEPKLTSAARKQLKKRGLGLSGEQLAWMIQDKVGTAFETGDTALYKDLFYRTNVWGSPTRVGSVPLKGFGPVYFSWESQARHVPARKAEWVAAHPEELGNAFGTWFFNRPVDILNLMGVGGMDESKFRTPLHVLGHAGARLMLAWAGFQAARYADYKTEDLTGVSPLKTLVGAGAAADVLRRVPLSPVYQGLEFLSTGSVDSPLSYGLRTVGLPAAGFVALSQGRKGLGLGLLAAGFLSAGDMTVGPVEAADIYSGEQMVEVRKGRWWGASSSSFWGEGFLQYRPHWVNRLMTDAAYKGYPYRDRAQYWEQQMTLPVPENWFGARPFAKPYEYDEYIQPFAPTIYSSPHPITEIPIVGPLLTPLAKAIKPARRMHPETPLPEESSTEASARKMLQGVAARNNLELEEEGLALGPGDPAEPYNFGRAALRMLRFAEEVPGVYGWAMFSSGRGLSGESKGAGAEYETAAQARSMTQAFYDLQLGGLLGSTELFRRLFPRPGYEEQQISNLPNAMPGWMPGAEDLGIDFKTGNPFTKSPLGWSLLPGPGYEARNPELQGVGYDKYPEPYRLDILSSVAPYSPQARRTAESIRVGLAEGRYGGRELRVAERSLGQYEQATGETGLGLEGGDASLVTSRLGIRGSKLSSHAEALPTYIRRRLLGPELERWEEPIETIALPAFREIGLEGGAVGGAVQGAFLGSLFAGSPLTLLAGSALGAAVGGGYGAAQDTVSEGIRVPQETEKMWQAQEYLDRLRFVKSMALYRQTGDTVFLETARRTMYGTNPFEEDWRVMAALPAADRKYVSQFVQAQSPDLRKKILTATPQYLDDVLVARWALADQAAGRLSGREERELTQLAEAAGARTEERLESADSGLQDYFTQNYLPRPEWSGWAVDVPLESAAVRMVENEGLAAEQFGIWKTEIARFRRMKNQPLLPDLGTPTPGGASSARSRLSGLLHPRNRRAYELGGPSRSDGEENEYFLTRSSAREVRAMMRYG